MQRRSFTFALLIFSSVLALGSALRAEDIASHYDEAAGRILGASLMNEDAYDTLEGLCDKFGNRLSGTQQLEDSIDWLAEKMKDFGLVNVHKEEVMVPVWVRGSESATLLSPLRKELHMLGLGRSTGTKGKAIEAEVLVVGSFDEMESMPREKTEGKIILFDVPFTNYGETVQYRAHGASRAGKVGAVAALVRSVGPVGHQTPHTGAMRYAKDDELRIPTAALSVEDSAMLHRMQNAGETLRLSLSMEADTLEDVLSHNLIGEVRGSQHPEEIVLIGGHIDSWDVGQGAQDDGVGCIISLEAAHLIQRLNLLPKRTIRVVLFTNEENGLAGGKAYLEAHRDELKNHIVAIESDTGNGLADGFRFDLRKSAVGEQNESGAEQLLKLARDSSLAILQDIAPLLKANEATNMHFSYSGADIGPIVAEGVPGMGLNHDARNYWPIHHTAADTFDRINKADLNLNVATMAIMAYVLADMSYRLHDNQ